MCAGKKLRININYYHGYIMNENLLVFFFFIGREPCAQVSLLHWIPGQREQKKNTLLLVHDEDDVRRLFHIYITNVYTQLWRWYIIRECWWLNDYTSSGFLCCLLKIKVEQNVLRIFNGFTGKKKWLRKISLIMLTSIDVYCVYLS